MPTTKLTQVAVEKLKAPGQGRMQYWDSQLPGFGIRVSDSGGKTWVALYRVGGKLVRETIGTRSAYSKCRGSARASSAKHAESARRRGPRCPETRARAGDNGRRCEAAR